MPLNEKFLESLPEVPKSPSMDGWKELPIEPIEEPLVPLGAFAGDLNSEYQAYSGIFTDAIYHAQHTTTSPYGDGLQGSLLTCFVRQGIADRLLEAQKHLPEGHAFVVWDTFRPLEVQQALFDDYRDQLVAVRGMSEAEATEFAQKYVSIPSTDLSRPSPHNTGASVDLTIVKFTDKGWAALKGLEEDLNSGDEARMYRAEMKRLQLYREETTPLNMGTVFDEMTDKVESRYYEDKFLQGELTGEELTILHNRRLLTYVMGKAGFSGYPEEWFHFDWGNQFHMRRTGEPAVYGMAHFSEANQEHEQIRRDHMKGSEILRQRQTMAPIDKLGRPVPQHPLTGLVQSTAQETGAMRETIGHDIASKLVA